VLTACGSLKSPAHESRWNSGYDREWLYIPSHDRPSSQNGTRPNRYTLKQRDTCSDPNISPNGHRFVNTTLRRIEGYAWLVEAVISSQEIEPRPDDRVISNLNSNAIGAYVGMGPDVDMITDRNIGITCDDR